MSIRIFKSSSKGFLKNEKFFAKKEVGSNFLRTYTAQKWIFPLIISSCDQIHIFLRIWSHLQEKSLTENFIFCAVAFSYKLTIVWYIYSRSYYHPWPQTNFFNFFSPFFYGKKMCWRWGCLETKCFLNETAQFKGTLMQIWKSCNMFVFI